MWKKLVLRGSTRNDKGGEELAYFRGGFGRLAQKMVEAIEARGGEVCLGTCARGVLAKDSQLTALQTDQGEITARQFLFTPAFPIIADLFEQVSNSQWIEALRRVRYLGNMCLVLRLKHSLSSTYWLNVNDPGFPFVGVIEHTNLDGPENYQGTHIAYLSRYLTTDDPVWRYSDDHLRRMFPEMDRSWVIEHRVWRAAYAQPVTERDYSQYVPGRQTPFTNATIATMAQIYPEDRGTNYAVRDGRSVAEDMMGKLPR